MGIETLRVIAEAAQAKLRHVYELYSLGEPPTVTPGLVDAVLEAAGAVQPQAAPVDPWHVTVVPLAQVNDAPVVEYPDTAALEAAVIALLRELSVNGRMPTQAAYNARRGDLPLAGTLYMRYGNRQWADWAALAGLRHVPRGGVGKRGSVSCRPCVTARGGRGRGCG